MVGKEVSREEKYMRLAIREARKALRNGDVPIGCVIVYDGICPGSKADENAAAHGILPDTVIGRGYNRRNRDHSSLMHAEILAIKKACKAFADWRLEDCTLYVTLEPCPMCAGAILQARLPRVVSGLRSLKSGSCGTVLDLLHEPRLNHQAQVSFGVLQGPCGDLLSEFFHTMRERENLKKVLDKGVGL